MFSRFLALCNAIVLMYVLAFTSPAYASAPVGFIPVSQSRLLDSNGNPVSNATVCARITIEGQSASVAVGGGGTASFSSSCAPVQSGVWSLNLPDLSLSTPQYACVELTITDDISGNVILKNGYSCIQPRSVPPPNVDASSFWCKSASLGCFVDLLPPNLPANVVMQQSQGPAGQAAVVTADGANNFTVTHNLQAYLLNGIPQADQFPGTDMCVKLRAANLYAVTNGISLVDATHFAGTQSCTVDPVTNLSGDGTFTDVNLVDIFGAVHIQTYLPWLVTNAGFSIKGMSAHATWLQYVGTANVAAVLSEIPPGFDTNIQTHYITESNISDISILGNSRVTDGLLVKGWKNSELRNVNAWNVTGCGIHTYFSIEPTLYRLRVSYWDAQFLNYPRDTTPTSGICLDGAGGAQTTAGTVVDAAVEGVGGTGINLIQAATMTFLSGTSEGNGTASGFNGWGGMTLQSTNLITVIGMDFEGNGGQGDVHDSGISSDFENVIAISGTGASGGVYMDGAYARCRTATGGCNFSASANLPDTYVGGEIHSSTPNAPLLNAGGFGWGIFGQGELDLRDDVNCCAQAVAFADNNNGAWRNLGYVDHSGNISMAGVVNSKSGKTFDVFGAGSPSNVNSIQGATVSNGNMCLTTTQCDVTVPWPVDWGDANYLIECSVLDQTAPGVTYGLLNTTRTNFVIRTFAPAGATTPVGYGSARCVAFHF